MRRAVLFGAAAALPTIFFVLAGSSSPASAQEHVPVPGAVYSGQLTDTTGECSRGDLTVGEDFSLLTSEYGASISGIRVTGLTYSNLVFTPSEFTLSVNIPVAENGSFSQDFSQFGVSVHIEGRFVGTGVSGSVRAAVGGNVECEGTFQAELIPPVRQESTFQGGTDAVDGCGSGSISITRAPDLLSVTRISVDGFRANGQTFSGSATFDEGTVPIDPDTGSFEWAYFAGSQSGQEIAVTGRFLRDSVTGLVEVSPSTCGSVLFSAYRGPLGGRGGPGLPATGTGPAAGSGAGWRWALALAAFGLTALLTGLALMRRRVPSRRDG